MVESVAAPAAHRERQVRQVVEAYYAAFNAHSIDRMKTIVTEDWVHINPLGGWTRGREAVVTELRTVHSTFLKDATDTPEEIVATLRLAMSRL